MGPPVGFGAWGCKISWFHYLRVFLFLSKRVLGMEASQVKRSHLYTLNRQHLKLHLCSCCLVVVMVLSLGFRLNPQDHWHPSRSFLALVCNSMEETAEACFITKTLMAIHMKQPPCRWNFKQSSNSQFRNIAVVCLCPPFFEGGGLIQCLTLTLGPYFKMWHKACMITAALHLQPPQGILNAHYPQPAPTSLSKYLRPTQY